MTENDEWCELEKIENWQEAPVEDLLKLIREKGIVGIGGAKFPYTHQTKSAKDT